MHTVLRRLYCSFCSISPERYLLAVSGEFYQSEVHLSSPASARQLPRPLPSVSLQFHATFTSIDRPARSWAILRLEPLWGLF